MIPSKTADQIAKELAAFFPVASLGWLPKSVFKDREGKNKAMALAYIDARDVMDRLDNIVGISGWKDEYSLLANAAVACKLSVRIGDEWVTKQDVGGQSDQEDSGDKMKAAYSDALKRAAIKFGIGRYLYALPDQFCECEVNDKGKFRKWVKQPFLPPMFMCEADKQHNRNLENAGKPKAGTTTETPPKADVDAKGIPKTGKALKERLEKADKANKGLLEFVAHCGVLWGYPSDITRWSGLQLEQSAVFGEEFVERIKNKVPKIKEEQDAEIRVLMAGDLERLQKACRVAQVYAADRMTETEAAAVIEVLKKGT